MKPLLKRPPINSLSSLLIILRSFNITLSSLFHLIKSLILSISAQSIIDTVLTTITPISASVPVTTAILTSTKRTVFKLIQQLQNFQNCTHKQYNKVDQLY